MKKNKYIYIIVGLVLALLLIILIPLLINKTFLKEKYIGIQGQEIFIPKYSYFKKECCMTAAFFYSLRQKKDLQNEIDKYMEDFEYFTDESTYGYRKNDLFIQSYEVIDVGLYRKIVITY